MSSFDNEDREDVKDVENENDEDRDNLSELRSVSESRDRPVIEELSGSLLRLKNKPSTFSSWDTRFLCVDSARECLNFFSSEKDRYMEPLQSLPLSHINRVQAVDTHSLQLIVKGKPETVIFLRASSPEEKMQWVHHLDLFIRELQVSSSHHTLLNYDYCLFIRRMKNGLCFHKCPKNLRLRNMKVIYIS